MATLMISLYSDLNSKYKDYMKENHGAVFLKKPGFFSLPSWLYSYWLHKNKVKIKGCQKISMYMSEFEEKITIMPSKLLGAILHYNCHFDFETLKSIGNLRDQQLYVLQEMHRSILAIADACGWEKEMFEKVYEQTREGIANDTIPANFWNVKLF